MANKYHVNKETGRANICRATGKRGCPLGADTPHFDNKEDAKAYIEKTEAENNNQFSTVTKDIKEINAQKNNNTGANDTPAPTTYYIPAGKNAYGRNTRPRSIPIASDEAIKHIMTRSANPRDKRPDLLKEYVKGLTKAVSNGETTSAQNYSIITNPRAPKEVVDAALPHVIEDIKKGTLTKEQNLSIITSNTAPKELVDASMQSGVSYDDITQSMNKGYRVSAKMLDNIGDKHIREIYPDLKSDVKASVLRYSSDEKLMDAAIKKMPKMIPDETERSWAEISAYHNENITNSQKQQLAANNKVVASLAKVDEIKKVEPEIENIAFSESNIGTSGFVELQFNADVVHKYNLSKDDINAMLKRKHDMWRPNMTYNEARGKYTFDRLYN